jgi:signal transduction histidine kinase
MATSTAATSTRASLLWARTAPRWVVDAGVWLLVAAPIVAGPLVNERSNPVVDVIALALSLVLIMMRRRWPIPVLATSLVALVTVTAVVERPTALLPVTVVLLFNVSLRHERATALWAAGAVLATVLACIAILVSNDFLGPELLAGLAWPALALAAGLAMRTRGEAIAAAEERAAQAEATREEEARRRVAEERLHIARELHDVIAHKIAVVNVQAGVATHLMRSKPDDAAAALATVRSCAREVLDELGGLLGVLRAGDDDGASTEPTPTLEDVQALVDSFDGVGLRVTFRTSGSPSKMTDAVAIAAYRTVQEALTNAHKHGDGHADLRIAHERDRVTVLVTNRLATSHRGVNGPGYGLVGMRERADAVGGEVTFGPQPNGTFVVNARLPHARSEVTT